MRKSSPLDALINKTTQAVLAATVLRPDRSWYLSDLAKHLRRRPSSLQEPLASLVSAEVLSRRKEGNRIYFQANQDCPFLRDLQGLIAKTVGLVEVLRDALAPLKSRIAVAFVHGSVAASRERAASDIDLIVVGSLGLSGLSPVLEKVEQRLGRPVNANVYSPEEFVGKISARSHFLCSVIHKEKLFIVGKPNDLERIARRKSR
jgi:predicted nucleotidyltransferase